MLFYPIIQAVRFANYIAGYGRWMQWNQYIPTNNHPQCMAQKFCHCFLLWPVLLLPEDRHPSVLPV